MNENQNTHTHTHTQAHTHTHTQAHTHTHTQAHAQPFGGSPLLAVGPHATVLTALAINRPGGGRRS
jgi:hypothetical protein